jgi:hypothetical protein
MNLTDLLLNTQALLQVSVIGIFLYVIFRILDKRFDLSSRDRGVVIAGAVLTCLGCLYFFLLYWNHFLGLRSGNGAFGAGVSYLAGLRPYRDYYCAVTPLDILKWAAVMKVLGAKLIVVRAFAVFDRMLLCLLLYFWLVRFFRARDAALATLVTIVVSAGDLTDPLASYNHDTILLAMLAGFLSSYGLDAGRSLRSTVNFAALAGVATCLSFGTKQTIGLAITVAIPIVVSASLLRLDGLRRALAFLGGFLAGWAASAGVIVAWLMHAGLWSEFLHQVFRQGPAAKASHPVDFLNRAVLIAKGLHPEIVVASLSLLLAAKPILNALHSHEVSKDSLKQLAPLVAVPVLGYFTVSTAFNLNGVQIFRLATIFIAVIASLAIGVYCFARWIFGRLNRFQAQVLLFAAVSFSVAFMLSLSWPFFEAMLLPGLALFIATTLDGLTSRYRNFVYVACGLLLMAQVESKLAAPFGFAGWQEAAVGSATIRSEVPEFDGLRLPREMVTFVDGTVHIVHDHATPKDTIFAYPEFGVLYTLTGHRPPTFSWSHNIDVINDQIGREEASRLLSGRPAVLIYGAESKLALRTDEQLWREGRDSGQRSLISAVESLASSYCLEREFHLSDGHTVRVYLRPDSEAANCTKK